MKAKIAVVTVSGKAYYLIVDALKRKNIPFLSLTPHEHVPIEIKVVITTEEEKPLITHDRVLTYQNGENSETLVNEAMQIIEGKENFEKITIGIDPGELFGLAVLAGGKVIQTENCFSAEETLSRVESILKSLENAPVTSVSVKIGDGVPACKEKLLRGLDQALPPYAVLEIVSEAGTNRCLNEAKNRRGLRDIVSAIQIAGRSGNAFHRRKTSESNS